MLLGIIFFSTFMLPSYGGGCKPGNLGCQATEVCNKVIDTMVEMVGYTPRGQFDFENKGGQGGKQDDAKANSGFEGQGGERKTDDSESSGNGDNNKPPPLKCKANTYKHGDKCVACPSFSTSPENSDNLNACICDLGYKMENNTCQLYCDHGYKPENNTCQPYNNTDWREFYDKQRKEPNSEGQWDTLAEANFLYYQLLVQTEEHNVAGYMGFLLGVLFFRYVFWSPIVQGFSLVKDLLLNSEGYINGLTNWVNFCCTPFRWVYSWIEKGFLKVRNCNFGEKKSIMPNKVKNGDKTEAKMPWEIECDEQWKCFQIYQLPKLVVGLLSIVVFDIHNYPLRSVLGICFFSYACFYSNLLLYYNHVIKAMSCAQGYNRSVRSHKYKFWLRKGFDWWLSFFHIPFAVHLLLLPIMYIVRWPQFLRTPSVIMDNMICWHGVEICVLLMVAFGQWQYNRVLDEKRVYIPEECIRLRVSWYYLPLYTPSPGESALLFDRDLPANRNREEFQNSYKGWLVDIRDWYGAAGKKEDKQKWTTGTWCLLSAMARFLCVVMRIWFAYQ